MKDKDISNKTKKRKLLALDGGGIRGIVTIEVLAKIESLLREELGRKDDETFVLSDYFDYIAGTSTGAIIATCLSLGMSVSKIRNFYLESGERMFDRAHLLKQFHFKFEDRQLKDQLKNEFKNETLGSDKLKTLLMLVLRNATTDSPWPISNNPYAYYNNPERPDCNLQFPLWQLVRASTAAPTFFPPEVIEVKEGEPFVFVDGGITMYNNPAFQLFLMATVEPYNLNWLASKDNMLLVSVGTGMTSKANKELKPGEMNLLYNATSIPSALMFAAQNEQDFLCRVFGDCLVGDKLDNEVKDMIGTKGSVDSKLFTYLRYNADLSREGLNDLKLNHIRPEDVQPMDSVQHISQLQEVGQAIAEQRVKKEHFQNFLS